MRQSTIILLMVYQVIFCLEQIRYYLFPHVDHPCAVIANFLPDPLTNLVNIICPTLGAWLGVQQLNSYNWLFKRLADTKADEILIGTLMKWARFQFFVLEIAAKTHLTHKVCCGLYQVARKFVKVSTRLAAQYCRQRKGPSPERDNECCICWAEISAEHHSIEHLQCHTYYHKHCLVAWASRSTDAFAVCGVCRGPITAGAEVVQTERPLPTDYRLSIIALAGKRSALVGAIFVLACIFWRTSFGPIVPDRSVSARLYELLLFLATVWCTRTATIYSQYLYGEYLRLKRSDSPVDLATQWTTVAHFLTKVLRGAMIFMLVREICGAPKLIAQLSWAAVLLGYWQAISHSFEVRAVEPTPATQRAIEARTLSIINSLPVKWARHLIVWLW